MKILVINADCLTRNSSANLCHLAYIRGLLEAEYEVSVLSADGRDYVLDANMQIPEKANSYTVYGVSLYEKFSLRKNQNLSPASTTATNQNVTTYKNGWVSKIKEGIRSLYGPHGIYSAFVKKASDFKLEEQFDILLSISTPPASHLLAYKLLEKGNVRATHWIQVWEDPWYCDAYGFNNNTAIYKEEKRLLSLAECVCYVSPLTLKRQQELYPESADKMYWQPVPAYYKEQEKVEVELQKKNIYGYFGDYTPAVRDLKPFYMAAKQTGITVNICGNPSGLFESTDAISLYPRLPLNELKPIENDTNVLIFLCNRRGGQIPGKIYQYSATEKTILFILDGTENEKKVLKEYFGQFARYIFCENTVEDITRAIVEIENNRIYKVINRPLDCFSPKKIVKKILCGVEEQT